MTAADLQPGVAAPKPSGSGDKSAGFLRSNYDLLVAPVIVVVGLALMFLYIGNQQLDTIEERALEPANVLSQLGQHLLLTLYSTVLVLIIAVPVGIAISRPSARRFQGPVLALGGFAQALPPFGVLLLLGFWQFGVRTAVIGLTLAALLPVLRNTVVGLQQVDRSLIEAARGMGMSARQTLRSVEIPLAIPVIVAGLRVATVLIVGIAAIAAAVNGPGLGEDIFSGLSRIGSASAVNYVLGGMLGVVVLAILFDAAYAGLARLTTARGIRA